MAYQFKNPKPTIDLFVNTNVWITICSARPSAATISEDKISYEQNAYAYRHVEKTKQWLYQLLTTKKANINVVIPQSMINELKRVITDHTAKKKCSQQTTQNFKKLIDAIQPFVAPDLAPKLEGEQKLNMMKKIQTFIHNACKIPSIKDKTNLNCKLKIDELIKKHTDFPGAHWIDHQLLNNAKESPNIPFVLTQDTDMLWIKTALEQAEPKSKRIRLKYPDQTRDLTITMDMIVKAIDNLPKPKKQTQEKTLDLAKAQVA